MHRCLLRFRLDWVHALLACVILLTTTPLVASSSQGATPFYAQPVKIIWNAALSRKAKGKKALAAKNDEFKAFCHDFGESLLLGKGPWGFGVFSSFGCFKDDELVDGTSAQSEWSITLLDAEKGATLTLTRGHAVIKTITLTASDATMKILMDQEFIDVLAYALLDAMPVGMQFSSASVKGTPAIFTGRYWRAGKAKSFKYTVPPPPAELVVYRLNWHEKRQRWESHVIGSAKVGKLVEPKTKKEGKRRFLSGGSVSYSLTAEMQASLEKGALWAQNVAGPNGRAKELDAVIQEAHLQLAAAVKDGSLDEFLRGSGSLAKFLLNSAAGGYVGMRYGLQILPGDSIISKTSMFSLLLELRGGPAKGLRYYYDKMPRVKKTETLSNGEKVTTFLESSRHVIGFSLGFDPGFLVDRLTFDPKIGIWSFNAALAAGKDESGAALQLVDFKLGTTASAAFEVGAELLSDWYTLRGWYAMDSGYSVLKKGGKVTSNRLGVDAYFTAGPRFSFFKLPVKTALLTFYEYESVVMHNGNEDAPAEGVIKIVQVPYSAGYAGVGVALSW